jgi:hypothetical protein
MSTSAADIAKAMSCAARYVAFQRKKVELGFPDAVVRRELSGRHVHTHAGIN